MLVGARLNQSEDIGRFFRTKGDWASRFHGQKGSRIQTENQADPGGFSQPRIRGVHGKWPQYVSGGYISWREPCKFRFGVEDQLEHRNRDLSSVVRGWARL